MALSARAAAAAACLLLALAAPASAAGSGSRARAPAPATDCYAAAASLSDCLEYVSPGAGAARPNRACCSEVKAAVASPATVDCLCSIAGDKNLGIPIDMKRVLALPGQCGASNAAFSKCHITAGAPTEAPAPSAGGSSTSGGATASPPVAAAASSPTTATARLVAAVAAPLLAYCYYLF